VYGQGQWGRYSVILRKTDNNDKRLVALHHCNWKHQHNKDDSYGENGVSPPRVGIPITTNDCDFDLNDKYTASI
jgi:hypothetical protein